MHATYRAAILREDLLRLAEQLDRTTQALVDLAAKHRDTIVPNYTNGVAAQANTSGMHCSGTRRGSTATRSACAKPTHALIVRRWEPRS
jgi:argininosuccinate lyase